MTQKADISGKQTINIYNRAWAEWVLQDQEIEVEAELSGEFQFIGRASDSLLRVRDKEGKQFLSLSELQLRVPQEMPGRLNAYAALAWHKYRLDVFVTVIYLLPPPEGVTIPTTFHRKFMGQVSHQDFQVIGLWELNAEQVLAFGNPALLPFVPLMHGGATEQILRQCATKIHQEPRALELETILSVFASYVLDTELIKRILRWEMQIIKESPILQEAFAEQREQGQRIGQRIGERKGERKGEHKATLESLYRILNIRFQVDELYFGEKGFELFDLETLRELNEIALTVSSLTDFENALIQFSK